MSFIILISILLLILLTGTPISFALCASVIIFISFFSEIGFSNIEIIAQKIFTGIESFPIMAIPFFILTGNFLIQAGTSVKIIKLANNLVGFLPGGLAMATVLACAFFSTISGSSPATVIAIGSIMLPALIKQGYSEKFSIGVIASSGSLGILIPPSIVLIIYAVSTSQSAGKMFLAGIIPGILLTLIMMSRIYFISSKNKKKETPNYQAIIESFKKAFGGVSIVLIIMVGIYGGFFTPTEAAVISSVYAFFLTIFFEKSLKITELKKILIDTAGTSAMLLFIITNAVLFSYVLTVEQIPQSFMNWVVQNNLSVISFLLMLNVTLLIAGQFMEPSSIILILAPLCLPVATNLGIDPIHLGIIMTINMEIGMITPPVGLNLFVSSHISKLNISEISLASLPWVFILLLFLMVITFIPSITLWLPNLVYG